MLSMASVAFFMGNIWNTCQRSVHTSSRQGTAACTSRSRRRIESGKQQLAASRLDEGGGKVLQIAEQGGEPEVGPVLVPGVGVPNGVNIVDREHRVDGGRSW